MIAGCGFIHLSPHFSGGEGEAEAERAGPGGCKSAVSWTPVSPHDNMAYIQCYRENTENSLHGDERVICSQLFQLREEWTAASMDG